MSARTHQSAAPTTQPAWTYFVADVVLVLLFAAIGRMSHGESLVGTPLTAWPFVVGTLLGWILVRAWRSPLALWPTATVIWISTVGVGMILRALTGQGTHWSFVIVSLVTNAVFFLGYRLVASLMRRRSDRV